MYKAKQSRKRVHAGMVLDPQNFLLLDGLLYCKSNCVAYIKVPKLAPWGQTLWMSSQPRKPLPPWWVTEPKLVAIGYVKQISVDCAIKKMGSAEVG